MGQGKAHWQTARQRVQSRRDSSWLWWRVHLPLVRSTLRTLAQARLRQSARSIRGPRAPTYVYTGNRLCFLGVDHVLSHSLSLSLSLEYERFRFPGGMRIETRCVVKIRS